MLLHSGFWVILGFILFSIFSSHSLEKIFYYILPRLINAGNNTDDFHYGILYYISTWCSLCRPSAMLQEMVICHFSINIRNICFHLQLSAQSVAERNLCPCQAFLSSSGAFWRSQCPGHFFALLAASSGGRDRTTSAEQSCSPFCLQLQDKWPFTRSPPFSFGQVIAQQAIAKVLKNIPRCTWMWELQYLQLPCSTFPKMTLIKSI